MTSELFHRQQSYRILMDKGSSISGLSSFFRAANNLNFPITKSIDSAIVFMLCQDYHHPGLSSMTYVNHPFRVASLLLTEFGIRDELTICLALLHNILELVSSPDIIPTLEIKFPQLVDDLRTLKVNRSLQHDIQYMNSYYNKISLSKRASLVKIADKFDNIFMISFNKNKDRRKSYIEEFKCHVGSLTYTHLPSKSPVVDLISTIVASMGYLDRETFFHQI